MALTCGYTPAGHTPVTSAAAEDEAEMLADPRVRNIPALAPCAPMQMMGLDAEAEAESRYWTAWVLLATTGMRRGEALGIRWSDVDLDAGHAAIRQTVIMVNKDVCFASRTKTGRSRVIDLDTGTIAALRTWRVAQAKERLLMGAGYAEHDLVLCHPDGQPFKPSGFSREFERRIARHGLRRIRLHDLRHTWATLALAAGVHPKVVQERLGHSNISITLDVYSHVTAPMRSEAAEQVAKLILGREGGVA